MCSHLPNIVVIKERTDIRRQLESSAIINTFRLFHWAYSDPLVKRLHNPGWKTLVFKVGWLMLLALVGEGLIIYLHTFILSQPEIPTLKIISPEVILCFSVRSRRWSEWYIQQLVSFLEKKNWDQVFNHSYLFSFCFVCLLFIFSLLVSELVDPLLYTL